MEVLIDTNILFGDWMLRTDDAKAFLAYIERTGSIIYVPKIVWEETQKNYQQDLVEKHTAYERASRALGRTLINQPDFKRVRIHEDDGEGYLDWLRKKLRFDVLDNVLPYGDFTERIAKRAMAKRKPFNRENNHEYKDCLVWETVIDVLAGVLGRGDNEVALISNDSNAFGAGKVSAGKQQERGQRQEKQVGVLHPQLQDEVDTLSIKNGKVFYYYESFSDFLSAHYTPIKGIDEESVRAYLGQEESGFAQLIFKELITRASAIASQLQTTYRTATLSLREFAIIKLSIIQSFYVYSFQRGEKISASGTVFVYLKTHADYKYAGDANTYTVDLYPLAEIKFSLAYTDGTPSLLTFENFSLPIGTGMRLPEPPKPEFEELIARLNGLNSSPTSVAQQLLDSFYTLGQEITTPLRGSEKFLTLEDFITHPLQGFSFDTVVANPPYMGDSWHIQDIREVKQKNLDSPSSKFLPKRGERTLIPKNIPSKRKKKGAKKR